MVERTQDIEIIRAEIAPTKRKKKAKYLKHDAIIIFNDYNTNQVRTMDFASAGDNKTVVATKGNEYFSHIF